MKNATDTFGLMTDVNQDLAIGSTFGEMSTTASTALYVALIVLCTSCESVYIPSVRNAPLLSRSREFQLSASAGNGMNLNTAYAVTNHIGLIGNAMYANDKWQYANSYRIHQSADAGLGYFGSKERISYELYAGAGKGKGYARDISSGFLFLFNSEKISSGSYRKIFMQPTIAFRIKRFQMAVTARVSRLDFRRLTITEVSCLRECKP